ncbi:hypothetical protein Val02_49400 [Virgisporangium aliadipatigenens]|uniref:Uncharacterized protein n=1 Tax=Virgisporangium aliadipatigenens TaxID=741659 RepID=A0A8J4DRU9_9ACTN|nr:hypothetical protein [Virgisporangium aliadipatigenens]GIJ48054.1 hypothetical protein Val02_49400 [Virgisporangium aliadipatigenens]
MNFLRSALARPERTVRRACRSFATWAILDAAEVTGHRKGVNPTAFRRSIDRLHRRLKVHASVAIRQGGCVSAYLRSVVLMSEKAERRTARSVVAEYHQAELEDLLARVAEAVDRYREGELDAFDVDQILFQYSRSAKELWKYCNLGPVEMAATLICERPPHDWWERGAPRRR